MSNIDIRKHPETHSMTVASEWPAPIEQVWQLWANPRKLERWWGPPMYPATVTQHDLQPGGRVVYYMTSPEGEKYYGYWTITGVAAPGGFSFDDGFALDASFAPNPDLPVSRNDYTFTEVEGGTRATYVGTYASAESLQQVLDMGVVEGTASAMNQIDALLAA